MGLINQWFGCTPRKRHHVSATDRPFVPMTEVKAAVAPDPAVEAETKVVQTELVQSLMTLGRRSAELRLALGQGTLTRVSGSPKSG
jgi:hypothetical protein